MGGSGLVAIALLVLAYAAVSRRLAGTAITSAIVFVAGGMLVSADALGWLDPTIEKSSPPASSGTFSRYMYGLGFETRSIRYTSSGLASVSISKRCDGTTWNASPAWISPTSRSTMAPYSSTVRCARCSGSGLLNVAIVGGALVPLLFGAVADASTLRMALILPVLCYLYIMWYGLKGHVRAA